MRSGGFASAYGTTLLRFTILRHMVTFQALIAQLLWLNHFESFVKGRFVKLLTIHQGVRTRAWNTNHFILWPRWCCARRKAFLLSRSFVWHGKNGSTKDGIGDITSFFHKCWQFGKRVQYPPIVLSISFAVEAFLQLTSSRLSRQEQTSYPNAVVTCNICLSKRPSFSMPHCHLRRP